MNPVRVVSSFRRLIPIAATLLAACGDATGPRDGNAIDLTQPWVEVAPANVGLDPNILDRGANRAAQLPRFRALLVARRGRMAFERYFADADAATLHDVRSVTKSIVAALAGIAVAQGSLPDLDAGIGDYLDGAYVLDDDDRDVTVRHLLTMTSGYQWNESVGPDYNVWITNGGDHVQYVLDRPRAFAPGDRWTYNSGAVHVLGVVIEHATGMSLPDFAGLNLFAPAGIGPVLWESLGSGTVNGGAGIDLRGRDLLRLGQLFLQGGRSGNRQVVPADWVDMATSTTTELQTRVGPLATLGYGHLWWTARSPAPAYFAWGFGGQFVYVSPVLDLVVVATTDWRGVSAEEGGASALEAAVMAIIINDIVAAVR